MTRCENCNISLPDNPSVCPLCGNAVEGGGKSESAYFPNLNPRIKSLRRRLIKLLAFLSVCVIIVCVAINLLVHRGGLWSVFVVAGIGSFWADFAVMAKRLRNPIKSMVWQTLLLAVIAVIWDIATGFKGWSIDFVYPIVCSCSSISIFFGIKLFKLDLRDYILYIIMDCILGALPIVISFILKRQMILPSVISFMVSSVLFAILLFFRWKELNNEVKRRMHI